MIGIEDCADSEPYQDWGVDKQKEVPRQSHSIRLVIWLLMLNNHAMREAYLSSGALEKGPLNEKGGSMLVASSHPFFV